MTAIEDRIGRMLEPSLESLGYELVRVQLSGAAGKRTLQIMADRADRVAMTVDDCAEISRTVSALLDVEDPIDGAYMLEVSSPGVDRPLTKLAHFERYAGFEAKVEMAIPLEGRKRFRGMLVGVENGAILLQMDDADAPVRLPIEGLGRAKLVMTDALLEAARREQEGAAATEGAFYDMGPDGDAETEFDLGDDAEDDDEADTDTDTDTDTERGPSGRRPS